MGAPEIASLRRCVPSLAVPSLRSGGPPISGGLRARGPACLGGPPLGIQRLTGVSLSLPLSALFLTRCPVTAFRSPLLIRGRSLRRPPA